MIQPTKKQMEKYNKEVEKKAKNFKLSGRDLHNLYDMFYMVNWQDYDTLKLNGLSKWFKQFFGKIEEIVLPELYEDDTTRKKKIN